MDARPLSDMFCKYFLQDYGLFIHFLNSVFDEQGLLILIKPNLSVFLHVCRGLCCSAWECKRVQSRGKKLGSFLKVQRTSIVRSSHPRLLLKSVRYSPRF